MVTTVTRTGLLLGLGTLVCGASQVVGAAPPYEKTFPAEMLCGPASLALAARRCGLRLGVQEIANEVSLDRAGTTLDQLARVATASGLKVEGFRLRSPRVLLRMADDASCIVLLKRDHFGLAWKAGGGDLWIARYPESLERIHQSLMGDLMQDLRVLAIRPPDSVGPAFGRDPHPALYVVLLSGAGVLLIVWLRRRRDTELRG